MSRPKTAQELIHWLEEGAGARGIALAAVLAVTVALSLRLAWVQFHGPATETTLLQADTGRQLARGEGFTTLVNYPQTSAFLAQRGQRFDAAKPYPELYQAPLYSMVIAAGLRVLPAGMRESLFTNASIPPGGGFGADYFLLGLTLRRVWLAAGLTFVLGRRLFDVRTGWLAAGALLVSVSAWQQTVAVNGTPLLMVLALIAFWILARLEGQEGGSAPRETGWLVALGAVCGLLFLAEYSAGALVLVALGYENALEIAYKEAEARVTELKRQLGQAKVDQILSARDRMRPFEEAAQKLEDETKLLTTLKLTLRQREIDFQVPKRTIEILNTAEPARRPSRPSWPLNIAFALVFGTILGVGAAVLLEYFDTSFRNVADVETRLKLPVLGVIPFHRDPLDEDGDPAETEPFRVLHTNLNLALKPGSAASLVLFSAGPGEGKSTTLHRLVRVMAASGERVILIDSDVRRPTQHRLGDRPRAPGLSEYMLNQKGLDEVIQKSIAPNLDFIPSGHSPGFTLGLLHLNRLKDLIATLRGRYDKIVFDSPPIIGVSDASVLASAVDGAILLIQHRRNPQSMVVRAQQIVDALKTPLIGVVLNQVPLNSGDDYGYYTNNYSYYSEGSGKSRRSSAKSKSPERSGDDKLVLNEPGDRPKT